VVSSRDDGLEKPAAGLVSLLCPEGPSPRHAAIQRDRLVGLSLGPDHDTGSDRPKPHRDDRRSLIVRALATTRQNRPPDDGSADAGACGIETRGVKYFPVAQTFCLCRRSRRSTMPETPRRLTRRNLPHWTVDGSTYFVTFRVASGVLSEAEQSIVLEHIAAGHQKYYRLAAALIMPDHAHLLIHPLPEFHLSRIMKGIKGVSARLVNQHRGTSGQLWQDESWDRIVRNGREFDEKLSYMADNPRKAELASSADGYVGWYRSEDF
jgi:putative transposase